MKNNATMSMDVWVAVVLFIMVLILFSVIARISKLEADGQKTKFRLDNIEKLLKNYKIIKNKSNKIDIPNTILTPGPYQKDKIKKDPEDYIEHDKIASMFDPRDKKNETNNEDKNE